MLAVLAQSLVGAVFMTALTWASISVADRYETGRWRPYRLNTFEVIGCGCFLLFYWMIFAWGLTFWSVVS